jgi:putative endonuclease
MQAMFEKKLSKKELGDIAEKKACAFLQSKGLSLVDRNYHSSFGEIDLIMRDKNEIVFIEVRSRAYATFGTAIESINKTKQQKVIKSAVSYLQKRKWLDSINYRFDVVGCSPTTIEWIKDAFSYE